MVESSSRVGALLAVVIPQRRRRGAETPRAARRGITGKVEVALYRLLVVPMISLLPARMAYGVACLRGDLWYRWDKKLADEVTGCLEAVLGKELGREGSARAARKYFRARSCEAVDATRLAFRSGAMLSSLVEVRGLEHLRAALARGRGAVLYSAHYGSYVAGFSLLGALGFPVTIIGRWASHTDRFPTGAEKTLQRLMTEEPLSRHLRHPNIEPRPGEIASAVQAAHYLRADELVATFLDPPTLPGETRIVRSSFLNGEVTLASGGIAIPKLTGSAVLMAFIRRAPDWRHQILEVSPASLEGDEKAAFERCLASVEKTIRSDPGQWLYWKKSALTELGLLG